MIKNTDLAWLAGIIDGEGSIMFFNKRKLNKARNRRHGWIATAISVTSCDELMIRRISNILYNLKLQFHFTLQRNDKRNNKWNVALKIETTGLNNCRRLLEQVEPYLINKKYLARFLLEYIKWRQDKGFGYGRKDIGEEEIDKWFALYDIVKQPKIISSETARRASIPLGMDDDTVRTLRRRKELDQIDPE